MRVITTVWHVSCPCVILFQDVNVVVTYRQKQKQRIKRRNRIREIVEDVTMSGRSWIKDGTASTSRRSVHFYRTNCKKLIVRTLFYKMRS